MASLTGCATRPEPPDRARLAEMQAQAWRQVEQRAAQRLDDLVRERARLREWKALGGECREIVTVRELREVTRRMGRETDPESLKRRFLSAHRTFWFGMDCDCQILVFFDRNGRATGMF